MKLIDGDIPGIIAFILILGGILLLLFHLSFLSTWLKIVIFFCFLIWFLRQVGIIFGAAF